jgi:hypothetical protein
MLITNLNNKIFNINLISKTLGEKNYYKNIYRFAISPENKIWLEKNEVKLF